VGIEVKSLDSPDDSRSFENGVIHVCQVGPVTVSRASYQPGWRWSQSVKPVVGTDSCQVEHKGYVVSGRIHVAMDDGTEADLGAGDAYHISPGHDAWVIGDELWVAVDFSEQMKEFAKPS
jgi:hypothetical protein